MKFIESCELRGEVSAPASKSDAQRAIAAGTLAGGASVLRGYSSSGDSDTALSIASRLGAAIQRDGETVTITGSFGSEPATIHCGESGLAFRLFAPIAALSPHTCTLTAEGTLLSRPIGFLESALGQFGVRCVSMGGYPPLEVTGPLRAGRGVIDASMSSQHVSGLLVALPLTEGRSELRLTSPTSVPYLQMTLATMKKFGISVDASDTFERFEIRGGQRYTPAHYTIEGDWSGAAFLLVGGAIAGEVRISNLNMGSLQADRQIVSVLKACGAMVTESDGAVTVKRSDLRPFEFDAHQAPDLFPPLTVLACYCEGTSVLVGSGRLVHKESNRARALVEEFTRLGACIRQHDDRLEIDGGPLKGGEVRTRDDHRIAMAAAIAALRSREGVTIDRPSCVEKSYPAFFHQLTALGAAS